MVQVVPFTEEYKKGGKENIQLFRNALKALKTDVLGDDFARGFSHFRGVEFVENEKSDGQFIATGSFEAAAT